MSAKSRLIKPVAFKPEVVKPVEPARPALGVTNAVHRQHEAIADEMGAMRSPAEEMILGGDDAPIVEEGMRQMTPAEALMARAVPRTEPLRPAPEPEKKKLFGLFGRKKDEPRLEPRTVPRATAQPIARPQPQAEAPRPQQPAAQNLADDLFPDQKRDEQFEIPAFLRRQSN